MGFTYVKVNLSNPARKEEKHEVALLVDTGAVLTAVSRKILEELQIKPVDKRRLRVFGGQIVERDIGATLINYAEAYAGITIIFAEEKDTPVLGATALEGTRLSSGSSDKTTKAHGDLDDRIRRF